VIADADVGALLFAFVGAGVFVGALLAGLSWTLPR
jgi:hypothetical protein